MSVLRHLSQCHRVRPNGDALLAEGQRQRITVKARQPELPLKDAIFRADPGRLLIITIRQRPMSPVVRCMLISHEFIYGLQPLQGDLCDVPALGWTTAHPDQIPQEVEAYGYPHRVGCVL